MISYKDFIKLIEKRGYTHNGCPTIIDESNPNIKTFSVQCLSMDKVLKLSCPDNMIMSVCGDSHNGGCPYPYSINIQCLNDEDKEPFHDLHYSTKLTDNRHIAAELIITKILNKDPREIDTNYKEWQAYGNPMLKLIGSTHPYEHVMWAGIYKIFSNNNINNDHIFLNNSFNLYENEKMIFYTINPDIDITKVKFELKTDILEYNGGMTNDTKQIY